MSLLCNLHAAWSGHFELCQPCVCGCVCVCVRARVRACTHTSAQSPSCVQLFARTVARQASLSLGFSRQEYWSMWPFPSSGDLFNPGIEQPASPALASRFFTTKPLGKPLPTLVKVDCHF